MPILLNEEIINDVFSLAGMTIGLCDYRPEKKGPFGRYTVKMVSGR